jgi:hypothetical protein
MIGIPSIEQIMEVADKFRNPEIGEQLSRIQGVAAPRDRVSYFGSLKKFAFFSRKGRFCALPDSAALTSLAACADLAGADDVWKRLTGVL